LRAPAGRRDPRPDARRARGGRGRARRGAAPRGRPSLGRSALQGYPGTVDVLFTMPSAHALLETLRDLLSALTQLAIAWVLPLLLALLFYISWRMLRMMPNTKPVEITPSSASSVARGECAGVEEVRAELQEVSEFLRHPGRFEKLGARVPHGVLLYGPPGTGKTLMAKDIAHEPGATFYFGSASAFVEMFAG